MDLNNNGEGYNEYCWRIFNDVKNALMLVHCE